MPATAPTKVSIVEDNDRIRTSLTALIDGSPGYRCVSAHSNAEDACRKIAAARPDVVLLDINLPGMSGIDCVRKLRTVLPAAKIVMHTVYEDEDRLFKSLRAGAHGYLLKRTPPSDLLKAIVDVRQGCAAMSTTGPATKVRSCRSTSRRDTAGARRSRSLPRSRRCPSW
jgi:DNA-binding NarL/FixJ family response regulator